MFNEDDFQWEEPSWEDEYPSYACVISLNENEYYYDNQDLQTEPILVNVENSLDIIPLSILSEYEKEQVLLQLDSMFIEMDQENYSADIPYDEELEMLYEEQLYENLMLDLINLKNNQ